MLNYGLTPMRPPNPFLTPALLVSLSILVHAQTLTETYRDTAGKLIGAAAVDEDGWKRLEYLCDRIGHRLGGSPALERAVQWAAEEMRHAGLENVATPQVKVPHWVRGSESAVMVEPETRKLSMLGLGGSVGTPAEGITAPVIAVSTFDELEALGRSNVEGKIVLYNVPFNGYGRTVIYRTAGASRAAELGAVAALVRSVGPVSLNTPHTGMLSYATNAPKIPAAALSIEAATQLARLVAAGNTVKVHLKMDAQTLPDADSANVVGEIRGSEKPEEVVVMGGHIDSWDVGQGAHDDGASCIAAMEALSIIKKLGLRPRRTLRVVLWTNEENGLAGGKAYREWIGERAKNHVAAIEMDGGAERPAGYGFGISGAQPETISKAEKRLKEIGKLLEGIDAGDIIRGGGGADISPLTREGVPGLGLLTSGGRYFEWHHTEADTLDKVNPDDFRLNIATLAVMGYVLADMPEKLTD